MGSAARAGANTAERILEAAVPLFAEHGFAGTSVRMVGTAADVNVATLAYHFSDKEGLYNACVERLYTELSQIDTPPPSTDDPLREFVEAVWRFVSPRRQHVRLLHRHLLDRGQHHEAFEARWMSPLDAASDKLFDTIRPDLSPTSRRLILYSSAHLLVRFVLDEPASLAHSMRVEEALLDETIVSWLTQLVKAQLIAA